MKLRLLSLLVATALAAGCSHLRPSWTAMSGAPARVIFDTDIGNDIDDALALAMLHALQSRGQCQLLAVTLSKDSPYAASYVDIVNTFYGRGDIPVGRVLKGKTQEPGSFLKAMVEARNEAGGPRYPRRIEPSSETPEAVALLRRTLAAQPDGSVIMIVVGFSTNPARLLESGPDAASPLSGRDLVAAKVKLLSMMAGRFTDNGTEYNIVMDVPAAQQVMRDWPTPIVMSPYEVGKGLMYPAASIEKDFSYVPHHPVAEAYRLYKKFPYDRPTWDLTSVLYALRPDRDYFTASAPGTVAVDDKGVTRFTPAADGRHRLLSCSSAQAPQVLAAMIQLSSQPPDRVAK